MTTITVITICENILYIRQTAWEVIHRVDSAFKAHPHLLRARASKSTSVHSVPPLWNVPTVITGFFEGLWTKMCYSLSVWWVCSKVALVILLFAGWCHGNHKGPLRTGNPCPPPDSPGPMGLASKCCLEPFLSFPSASPQVSAHLPQAFPAERAWLGALWCADQCPLAHRPNGKHWETSSAFSVAMGLYPSGKKGAQCPLGDEHNMESPQLLGQLMGSDG